ncbi:threonine aldolase family protein [Roseateles saccharophilus]|uniref:L-threonine aldolase n=1 Tax=Roseateles saccharophilus TaxID=304 RepID=A0A4R3VJP1_ROSSA|nr:beta-eliminating lyase-related protein [Roseateles saccharophilus]MDG0831252.1 threonine aldolase [Roseateles saccharophilus]TCV04373.1 L-threonine aldolase [Roseateles saccharophilus]
MPATRPAHADIELRNRCSRWLNAHRPLRSMRESLLALAELPEAALPLDVYGEGEAMQALEVDVATLLGKPAARFFHKGVAAQLAALRVACGEGAGPVALHPQSHIAIDEAEAFEALLGLRGLRVGAPDTPFTATELAALPEKPAVVVVELPLRRGGFRLPDWEALVAISAWCRAEGVWLHFDGARLWEAAPHYGRALADIAALADSVYVSFYKGLGGLAGSVLAGPADFIAAAAPWQTRLAGNVYTLYPMVLSALDGLRRRLPQMGAWRERARALAALLAAEPGWQVAPEPPQTNSFQLHLPVAPEKLREAMLEVARRQGSWLGARAAGSGRIDCGAMVEIVIGEAADDWSDAEALAAWRAAVALSASL